MLKSIDGSQNNCPENSGRNVNKSKIQIVSEGLKITAPKIRGEIKKELARKKYLLCLKITAPKIRGEMRAVKGHDRTIRRLKITAPKIRGEMIENLVVSGMIGLKITAPKIRGEIHAAIIPITLMIAIAHVSK